MKTLKNKIFAGALALATLGILGNISKASAQTADYLYIKIDTFNIKELNQQIWAKGYYNDKFVAFVGCNGYKDNQYTGININWGSNTKNEEFRIDHNKNLIDYKMYLADSPYKKIVEFKNLTKEQISQDKEFAERTKRIINACESKTKLRNMVKEVYRERNIIYIPQIKQ